VCQAGTTSDANVLRKAQQEVFQTWMSKFSKAYATEEEYETRFQNFIATSLRVEEQNRQSKEIGSSATFGLTKFADLTMGEFRALLGTRLSKTEHKQTVVPSAAPAPPNSWDWRTKNGITGPKNEGQCGSCWAMTVAMAIESTYMVHKGKIHQQALSTQQIIDCDTNDEGCNGGEPTTAYQYVVKAGGLATNSFYPYTANDGTCRNLTANELQDPITGYVLAIPAGSKDEIALAGFLASNQPISTAVDAESWSTYTGGILMASQCGQNIDHGVQIVAYQGLTKNGYWVIRNMWGTDWGEDGFIRLQFGENTCGLTSLPTVPTLP